MRSIYISIKPEPVSNIVKQEKNHEFRTRKPADPVLYFYIYETLPIGRIRYLAQVDEPIEFPQKITKKGLGNDEFNQGKKKAKYAFPIIHLFELEEPLSLKDLKEIDQFVPPQSYAYTDRYPRLTEEIIARKKHQIL